MTTVRLGDKEGAIIDPRESPGTVVALTPSLDTNAYADGDVLFAAEELASVFREAGGNAVLESITAVDSDDQGVAMDLVFFSATATLGTENAAVSISDADAVKILGIVSIAAADFVDLINSRVATKAGLRLRLKAAAASTSLWIAGITRGGTPTHTATGLKLLFGFAQG